MQVGAGERHHRRLQRLLHTLQPGLGQGSEQRRQHAPLLAEVLQKLSVKRFIPASRHRPRTPREPTQCGRSSIPQAAADEAGGPCLDNGSEVIV